MPVTTDTVPPPAAEQPPVEWSWFDYCAGLVQRMLILFGFYVLSIGPLYWRWYSSEMNLGSPFLRAFYRPLWILAQQCEPFAQWLDFYVQLWVDWRI